MDETRLDLKIVRSGKAYSAVPLEKLRQWAAEHRIVREDLVRPVGAKNWMKVSLAPEFAGISFPGKSSQSSSSIEGLSVSKPGPSTVAEGLGIVAPAKSRPRRRSWRPEEAAMDMTPMIDVTFQLLIFFMLTNKAANPSLMEVPKVVHGQGIDPQGRQVLLIDEGGQYYLGDRLAPESAGSLEEIVARVAENAAKAESEGALEVVVHAHKESKHLAVRKLMDQLRDVPNLGPVRLGVEEKD